MACAAMPPRRPDRPARSKRSSRRRVQCSERRSISTTRALLSLVHRRSQPFTRNVSVTLGGEVALGQGLVDRAPRPMAALVVLVTSRQMLLVTAAGLRNLAHRARGRPAPMTHSASSKALGRSEEQYPPANAKCVSSIPASRPEREHVVHRQVGHESPSPRLATSMTNPLRAAIRRRCRRRRGPGVVRVDARDEDD